MPDFAKALGASKGATTLLVLFIPSKDRTDRPIDQGYWVDETLTALGTLFGGATAFPQGKGVWRDDAQGGKLLFDEPVVIQCYTLSAFVRRFIVEASQDWPGVDQGGADGPAQRRVGPCRSSCVPAP
jgi:hypothetical protein